MTEGQWLTLAAGLISAGAVLVAALVPRWSEVRSHRRDQYANAIRALVAWVEFPYRVARRTSDSPEELSRLAHRGHDLQEELACHLAWVAAESRRLGDFYCEVAEALREAARHALRAAWQREPATTATAMNVGSLDIDEDAVRELLLRLHRAIRHRFGLRRAAGWLWRWALPTFRARIPTPTLERPPLDRPPAPPSRMTNSAPDGCDRPAG